MKFRKKPIVIEAWHLPENWPGEGTEMMPPWLVDAFGEKIGSADHNPNALVIMTLEGEMLANPGDWIIKGVAGELYPCKPDIFEQTYEVVE